MKTKLSKEDMDNEIDMLLEEIDDHGYVETHIFNDRTACRMTELPNGHAFHTSVIPRGDDALDYEWLDSSLNRKQRDYLRKLIDQGRHV